MVWLRQTHIEHQEDLALGMEMALLHFPKLYVLSIDYSYRLLTIQPYPDRRASVAPSVYSTQSSAASYYSPNPDAISGPTQHSARIPSGHGPPPSFYSRSEPEPYEPSKNGERRASGREQVLPPTGGLSAAQAYQASTGYHSSSSPASVVFPHRAPGHTQGDSSRPSNLSSSQSPPLARKPTFGNVTEESGDYVKSLDSLSINTRGTRPLDGLVGIPKIGEFSDFGSFETDFSGTSS